MTIRLMTMEDYEGVIMQPVDDDFEEIFEEEV